MNKYKSDWRKKNPDKVKLSSIKSYNKHKESRLKRVRKEKDVLRFCGNRQNALERDNWECQNCGMSQEQHILLFRTGLNVHHKDDRGNKKSTRNNGLDNLQTLCVRCHAKV